MGKPAYGKRGDAAQRKREKKVIREIADLRALGWNLSQIATELNEDAGPRHGRKKFRSAVRAPEGGKWSRKQVDRVIEGWPTAMKRGEERHNAQTPAPKLPGPMSCGAGEESDHDTVEIEYPDGKRREIFAGYWPGEEPPSPEDVERMRLLSKQLQAVKDAEPWRFKDPMDPKTWAAEIFTEGYVLLKASQDIGKLGLAGKDTWDRAIDALVVELTKNTGKDAHALIDDIKDQPGVKGPLRRVLWGLLREIALQRQANLSLRQQLGQKAIVEHLMRPEPVPLTAEEAAEREATRKRQADREETRAWRTPGHGLPE